MKITFVGTSHGIPEADRFCSSTFLEIGESCYIIDAGAPVSPMLCRLGIPHDAVKGVFITHLHGDHFDGLFELVDQLGWRYLSANPRILLPEEKGKVLLEAFLKTMATTKRDLDIVTFGEGEIFDDQSIKVTAIPTDHSDLPSYAFLLEAEGKKILFTGDMSSELSEYDRLFKDKEYDLVVFEGAHAELKARKNLLSGIKTKGMIVNHYYELRNSSEDMKEVAEELDFPFWVAADLETIEI